jgi:Mobilization protein NikA
MSGVAAEALRQQALDCGLTMSELIRRRIGGQSVVSRTDRETARSIDQLGRMLKHLYPKGQDWATPDERTRWWVLVTELEHTAKALRASAPGAL